MCYIVATYHMLWCGDGIRLIHDLAFINIHITNIIISLVFKPVYLKKHEQQ